MHFIENSSGEIYGIGKNTDNALGLGTWSGKEGGDQWKYSELQRIEVPERVKGIAASLGCSIVWTDDGKVSNFSATMTLFLTSFK